MEIRKFNELGISAFLAFLDSHTGDTPQPYPESILTEPKYSDAIEPVVSVERRGFNNRFELAEYLHQRFDASGFRPDRTEVSLWAWLGCFYFREICPAVRGKLQPGASARWIPQTGDWRRYYRHLLAGPYGIYYAHRDSPKRAMAVLCQRPGRPGDLVEQLASRQQVVTNPTIMQVATDCYVDPSTGKQLSSANRKGAGGARRFIDVLSQFDVTWDLSMLSPGGLHAHLPKEFRPGGEATS